MGDNPEDTVIDASDRFQRDESWDDFTDEDVTRFLVSEHDAFVSALPAPANDNFVNGS